MDDRSTAKRKIDNRLIAALAALCVVLVLALVRAQGGSGAPARPVAIATAPPPITPTGLPLLAPSPTVPAEGSNQLIGVWQQTYPDTTIQLQIKDWKAASASAVLYVSDGRISSMAIYKGRVAQQARTINALGVVVGYATTFSVAMDSSTKLPNSYAWCRRLTGSISPEKDDLDIAPLCTDGTGRGIINHLGSGSIGGTIPSVLLDSGAHAIHLGSTSG